MTERMRNARKRLEDLVAIHPELTLWEETPIQSATNAVLYGAHNDAPIVFKIFERAYRKVQDERMLGWLAPSGVVPKLYPVQLEDVLVMQRLPGQMLYEAQEQMTPDELVPLYRQVGTALSKLVAHAFIPKDNAAEWQNPHTDEPFWNTTFALFFDQVITTSLEVLEKHHIAQPAIESAIKNLWAARSEVLDRPTFMHVDDVHGANMMVHQGNLSGIFDFEMSRPGNELYLLGATLQWACQGDPHQWKPMLAGYEQERSTPLSTDMLDLVKLFTPFQNLIRFSWYWGSDEQPDWVWERNVRQKIVDQLVAVLKIVDDVTT